MPTCKLCGSISVVKNGVVRHQQRYRCKDCQVNFVLGDRRIKPETEIKRAFAVILYAVGKSSMRFIARLFDVSTPAVLKWLRVEAKRIGEPEIAGTVQEMEFDEMWHFIGSKKTKDGSSKPWIVLHGEPLLGLSAIVILQRSEGSITK